MKNLNKLLKVISASSLLFLPEIALASQKASQIAENSVSGSGSFTNAALGIFAFIGVCIAGMGILELTKGRNNQSQTTKGESLIKVIGGGALFSILGIILAFNMELMGSDAEFQQTKTLIQQTSN